MPPLPQRRRAMPTPIETALGVRRQQRPPAVELPAGGAEQERRNLGYPTQSIAARHYHAITSPTADPQRYASLPPPRSLGPFPPAPPGQRPRSGQRRVRAPAFFAWRRAWYAPRLPRWPSRWANAMVLRAQLSQCTSPSLRPSSGAPAAISPSGHRSAWRACSADASARPSRDQRSMRCRRGARGCRPGGSASAAAPCRGVSLRVLLGGSSWLRSFRVSRRWRAT